MGWREEPWTYGDEVKRGGCSFQVATSEIGCWATGGGTSENRDEQPLGSFSFWGGRVARQRGSRRVRVGR